MAVVIPYTRQTWTDGVSSCSAARNNVHEDGINDAHYMPAVRVTNSGDELITTGTLTTLDFNTERFDTAGNAASTMHDTVTLNQRLTCRYAGKYLIVGQVQFSAGATGYRFVSIRLNGTTEIARDRRLNAGAADPVEITLSTLWDLAVNDYVELRVLHNQGTSLNILKVAAFSPEFSMHRVG